MATTTPNLGLTKPTVGADADAWGTQLNASLDVLDAKVLDKTTGGTVTGPLSVTEALSGNTVSGNGAALTNLNATNIATGTIANARTTATSANTANAIVARDVNGDFSVRTIGGSGSAVFAGILQSVNGTEAQFMATKTGAGASNFYGYNNATDNGLFDSVHGSLIQRLKSNQDVRLLSGSVVRWQFTTNSDFSRVIPGGTTLYPDFACRAWVNFNGTNGAIRAAGNVTSVGRNASGDYTINFSTAMPDANYAAVSGGALINNGGGDDTSVLSLRTAGGFLASSYRVWVKVINDGAGRDTVFAQISFFR